MCQACEEAQLMHRVTVDPAVAGGRPYLGGAGVTVAEIIDHIRAGVTQEWLRSEYPRLERADIVAAVGYYTQHPEAFPAPPGREA